MKKYLWKKKNLQYNNDLDVKGALINESVKNYGVVNSGILKCSLSSKKKKFKKNVKKFKIYDSLLSQPYDSIMREFHNLSSINYFLKAGRHLMGYNIKSNLLNMSTLLIFFKKYLNSNVYFLYLTKFSEKKNKKILKYGPRSNLIKEIKLRFYFKWLHVQLINRILERKNINTKLRFVKKNLKNKLF